VKAATVEKIIIAIDNGKIRNIKNMNIPANNPLIDLKINVFIAYYLIKIIDFY